jgi:hypothetical protein
MVACVNIKTSEKSDIVIFQKVIAITAVGSIRVPEGLLKLLVQKHCAPFNR